MVANDLKIYFFKNILNESLKKLIVYTVNVTKLSKKRHIFQYLAFNTKAFEQNIKNVFL